MMDETQEFDDEPTRAASRENIDSVGGEFSVSDLTQWPGLEPEETQDQDRPAPEPNKNRQLDDPQYWPNIDGYVIEKYLGGGGFGDVFKARSIKLGGPVAIKILKPQYSLDKIVTKRFQQEVQAAALTRHTHVVQVLDTDLSTKPPYENCRYLVTEYLPGGDFSLWLKQHSPAHAHLDATVRILIGVCRGLEAIHRNGIVHRDLKPDNILIDADGVSKVGDFGLSVLDLDNEFRLTGSDQIFGTLPYMAPEQILSAKNAVPASDQYAVGVMLYVVLCKLRPWQHSTKDVQERSRILSNLKSTPPAPIEKDRQADKRLQEICLKCLQPLPNDRYSSVKNLRIDLESWLHDETIAPMPNQRPNRIGLGLSIAAVLMLLCGLFFLAVRNRRGEAPTTVSVNKTEDIQQDAPDESESNPGQNPFSPDLEVFESVTTTGGWLHGNGNSAINREQIAKRQGWIYLASVNTSHLNDIGPSRIARLPGLRHLILDGESVDHDAFTKLIKNPNIQWLQLAKLQPESSRHSLQELQQKSRLQHLSMLTLNATDANDGWSFLEDLPSVRVLSIHGKGHKDVENLGKYAQLTAVGFTGCEPLSEEVISSLRKQNPDLVIRVAASRGQPVFDIDNVVPAAANSLIARGWKIYRKNGSTYENGNAIGWSSKPDISAPTAYHLAQDDCDAIATLDFRFDRLSFRDVSGTELLPNFLRGLMLHTVDLRGSDITDETLEQLGNGALIDVLDLRETKVSLGGAQAFKREQPTCLVRSNFGVFDREHRFAYREGEPNPEPRTSLAPHEEIYALAQEFDGAVLYRPLHAQESRAKLRSPEELSGQLSALHISFADRAFDDHAMGRLTAALKELDLRRTNLKLNLHSTSISNEGLMQLEGIAVCDLVTANNPRIKPELLGDRLNQMTVETWNIGANNTGSSIIAAQKVRTLRRVVVSVHGPTGPKGTVDAIAKSQLHSVTFGVWGGEGEFGEDRLELLKNSSLRNIEIAGFADVTPTEYAALATSLPTTVVTPYDIERDHSAFHERLRGDGHEFMGSVSVAETVPTAFEIDFIAKRTSLMRDGLGVVFPIGDSFGQIVFGGWDGTISAIERIDGIAGGSGQNPTRIEYDPFEDRKEHRIKIRVTSDSIEGWVDGKQKLSWRGDSKSISQSIVPESHKLGDVFFVSHGTSCFHVSNLTIKSKNASAASDLRHEHSEANDTDTSATDVYSIDREAFRWIESVGGQAMGGRQRWNLLNAATRDDEQFVIMGVMLEGLESFSQDDVDLLANLPQLGFVSLTNSRFGPEDLARLVENPDLQWLQLVGTDLSSEDLVTLAALPYISTLKVGIDQIDDNWEFLAHLPTLRTLSIHGDSAGKLSGLQQYKNLNVISHLVGKSASLLSGEGPLSNRGDATPCLAGAHGHTLLPRLRRYEHGFRRYSDF